MSSVNFDLDYYYTSVAANTLPEFDQKIQEIVTRFLNAKYHVKVTTLPTLSEVFCDSENFTYRASVEAIRPTINELLK